MNTGNILHYVINHEMEPGIIEKKLRDCKFHKQQII